MKINEVTIRELVKISHDNWGYAREKIGVHDITTVLSILTNNDYPFCSTGNLMHLPCLVIWVPFAGHSLIPRKNSKNKIVGIYTLTNKEWNKLINSGFIEAEKELEKTMSEQALNNVSNIARKLYGRK